MARLGGNPTRLERNSGRLDRPASQLGHLPARLNQLTARSEEPAICLSERTVRLETVGSLVEGSSRAVNKPTHGVAGLGRAVSASDRAGKYALETTERAGSVLGAMFTNGSIMRDTREGPQWATWRTPRPVQVRADSGAPTRFSCHQVQAAVRVSK
jgi:hypothetical protein